GLFVADRMLTALRRYSFLAAQAYCRNSKSREWKGWAAVVILLLAACTVAEATLLSGGLFQVISALAPSYTLHGTSRSGLFGSLASLIVSTLFIIPATANVICTGIAEARSSEFETALQ